jgi:hypothetical protein
MNPSPDLGLLVDEILAELHAASPAAVAHDAHRLYVRRALPFARALAMRGMRIEPENRVLPRVAALLDELRRERHELEILADLRSVTRGYAASDDDVEPYRELMCELAALDEHFAQWMPAREAAAQPLRVSFVP